MKKYIVLLLAIVGALVLVACDVSKSDYEYPTTYQHITGESDAYTTVNGLTITKGDIYYSQLVDYGVDAVNKLVDNDLLAQLSVAEKEAAIKEYKQTNGEDAEYDEEEVYLNYRRYLAALKAYEEKIDPTKDEYKDTYCEKAYKTYFEANYTKSYDLKVKIYYSEVEAMADLKSTSLVTDADFTQLNWTNDAQNVFNVLTNVLTVNCKDVKKFANYQVIIDRFADSDAGDYTRTPQPIGDMWYVAYYMDNNYYVDANYNTLMYQGNEVTAYDATTAEEIFKPVVAKSNFGAFTSSTADANVATYMYKLRQDKGMQIAYEGLEVKYGTAYNAAFANSTDNDDFKEFTGTDATFTVKCNDKTYSADDIYAEVMKDTTNYLVQAYMITAAINDIKAYKVENGNLVVNNEDAWDDAYDDYLASIKKSFNNNGYLSAGYPKNYGWSNFLRDYYGATSQDQYIAFVSNIFQDSMTKKAQANVDAKKVTVDDIVVTYDSSTTKFVLTAADKWTETHDVTLAVLNNSDNRPADDYTVDYSVMPIVSIVDGYIKLKVTYKHSTDTSKAIKTATYKTSYTDEQYFADIASDLYDAYIVERDASKIDYETLLKTYGYDVNNVATTSSVVVTFNTSYTRWDLKAPEWDAAYANAMGFGTSTYSYYVYKSYFSGSVETGYTVDTTVTPTVTVDGEGYIQLTFTTYKGEGETKETGSYTYTTSYKLNQTFESKKTITENKLVGNKFSVACSGLQVYVDANFDGVKDEVTEDTVKTLMTTVANKVWARITELHTGSNPGSYDKDGDSYATCATRAIREYKMNTTDADYVNAKAAGIVVTSVSSTTYTETSSVDANLLKALQEVWTVTTPSVNGSTLDPVYRSTANSKVYLYTPVVVDAIQSDEDNCVYKYAVVKFSSVSDSTTSSAYSDQAYANNKANTDSCSKEVYEAILNLAGISAEVKAYFEELVD